MILLHVARDSAIAPNTSRAVVGEIFQSLNSIFPRINTLIGRSGVAMSEQIIIQAVYIAIGPFFVVEAEGEGKTKKGSHANSAIATLGGPAMRALRLDALALIRSVSIAGHRATLQTCKLTGIRLDFCQS